MKKKLSWPMKFVRPLLKHMRRVFASKKDILELSRLMEQHRMVVLKPYFGMKGNETGRAISHAIVKDFIDEYQTIRLQRSTMREISVPGSAALLRYPLALVAIPSVYDEYLTVAGGDNRRMIRKAEKQGYTFEQFDWDKYLDDIFLINTSKDVRSAGVVRGWYREPVKPRGHSRGEDCYQKYYGIFKDGSLCAYLNLILCGDCGYFKHFIGHADHLKYGIMNYLVSCTVREYVAHPHIKWLNYGAFPVGQSGSTIAFRKHSGFKGYAAFFDLEDDEKSRAYARRILARGLTSL